MSTIKLTNALLLIVAVLLGILAFRPSLAPDATAASKPWQNYVPITAFGDEVAFFDSATGDYVVYNWKKNTLRKLGNIGNAQQQLVSNTALPPFSLHENGGWAWAV